MKNRIQATLNKYGWVLKDYSDPFGKKARVELILCIERLPSQTAYVTGVLMNQLDALEVHIGEMEKRIRERYRAADPNGPQYAEAFHKEDIWR